MKDFDISFLKLQHAVKMTFDNILSDKTMVLLISNDFEVKLIVNHIRAKCIHI